MEGETGMESCDGTVRFASNTSANTMPIFMGF